MPPPSQFAILLILGAALLHALWNSIVKGADDRILTIGLIGLGNAIFGIALALFVAPPAPESYPFIVLTVLIHFFYFVFLIAAYRLGDFSQVYPIARGVAPVLVACGAMIFVGEFLHLRGWIGLLMISFAIFVLVFSKSDLKVSSKAVGAALLTGICIASYTIVDGSGVRVAGSALGYIGWSFGAQIVLGIGFILFRYRHLHAMSFKGYVAGIAGGLISGSAYALAIYAMSLTTLGSVSAIRESSVIIAALIGVIWFGERPWASRLTASIIVAAGIFMLAS